MPLPHVELRSLTASRKSGPNRLTTHPKTHAPKSAHAATRYPTAVRVIAAPMHTRANDSARPHVGGQNPHGSLPLCRPTLN